MYLRGKSVYNLDISLDEFTDGTRGFDMTCPPSEHRSRESHILCDALANLSALALALHRLTDVEAILDTTLSRLVNLTGASMGVVYTVENGDHYRPALWYGFAPQGEAAECELHPGVCRKIARGRVFPLTDPTELDPLRPSFGHHVPDALIGVPFIGPRDPEGIAFLGFQHPPALNDETLELLTAIGVQAGIAIYRAREVTTDRAARAMTERLHRLLDSSLDLILTLDGQGRITYANARLKEITGYEKKQVLGKTALRFAPRPLRRALWERWKAVRVGYRQVFDAEFYKADGTTAACQVLLSPVEGTDTYLLVIRDLTEERALRSRLIQIEKSAALGRLAAGAAHELNNPLTAVLGFAQILREEIQDETAREDLERIIRGALRARRIVQNLLAFARQESPVRTRTDVNETLRTSLEELSDRIVHANVDVITELQEGLPNLWADARQLKVVWDNLIKNACQAMEPQGGGRLFIRTELLDDVVRVLVRDTGPGIPMAYLGRIFDPFFTTKDVGKGVGLGLSLCKGIVEAHGGQIWAESTEGEGAAFIVELPVDAED